MAVKSLWGSIDDLSAMKVPHEVIVEQGEVLTQISKGMLEMHIERKQNNAIFSYDVLIGLKGQKLRQRILRLTHDIKLYPAILHDEQGSHEYKCKDQEAFEESLGQILSSPDTALVIRGFLAQARLGGDDTLV